ncbi:MAG: hypothetical protein AB7V50_07620 [Vampirovibrionia bacterium]
MAFSLATTWATTKKDFNGGDGGLNGDVVLTFEVAASTSISKGMFLKLSSGYATPCTATTDTPIGVALQAVDNSSGSAGDLEVSVLVRGIAQVNVHVAESGSYDDALVPFTRCGLSDNGVASMAGQSVSCGADPTVYVGTMLSTEAVPATADVNKLGLIYIDLLGPSRAI